ncbi:MAG: bifunctional tetrahydrofolate synthase/dihydrofolate synthase [Ruminococcus sp.]|nr:bifunctional tetrahydrofolate synthase/dihydrofolate synthase [Ruminococcus sp.]
MNYSEAMDFINSYTKSGGRVSDLSRAENLMRLTGFPEKKLRFVHIAGTNGKGSVVEYISNALIFSGYRVGQFTSPYIVRYTDRIRVSGTEIDEDSLCRIAAYVKSRIDDAPYSQFEITMAIALLWYIEQKCDIVVLETGIGGLLDCTNVIPPPLLSVITSVSLDHTALLGDTVTEIARHKAGIIKPGSAVVLSEDNPLSVKEVVSEAAENAGAELVPCEPCKPYADGGLYSPFLYRGIRLTPAMPGIHQFYNSQAAITACIYLRRKGFEIPESSLIRAIESTRVRGRVQLIEGRAAVLVDGSHNPAGARALASTLIYLSTRNHKIYTIMGMVRSKDYAACVKTIAQESDLFFAVDDFSPDAVPAETIADIASFWTETSTGSLSDCLSRAEELAAGNGGIVVICGSLYLAGEYLNKTE